MSMYSIFEKSPLEQLFNKPTNRNYKPRVQSYESIKDVPLRDAIIYLEKKAEEMEQWSMIVNVSGLTQTEIEELDARQKAQIAPFRRAIYELKTLNLKSNDK